MGEAISQMFCDEILSDLDVIEKLILASMVLACRMSANGDEGVSAQDILDRVGSNARFSDIPVPRDAFILKSIRDLHTAGIIKIEDAHKRLFEKATVNIEERDLTKVIMQDSRLEWLRSLLAK